MTLMADLRELTPEERAKPYAKYYDMELGGADPELLKLLERDAQIDPSQALMPEDINDLLEPGNFDVETGWGMLDNGAGYIAVRHLMPGITVEMVEWWFAWHGLEPLRYKIWYPPCHLDIAVEDVARRKILDPTLPNTAKFRHVIHHVTENVGMGVEHVDIHFLRPEEMGFDMSRFKAPAVGTMVGGFGFSVIEHQPPGVPPAPAIMCHFIREVDGGIEWRTRFWMGYTILDGKPVCLLPPGVRIPEEAPYGLANHNVHEYGRFKALLPLIYAEQGGAVA
jgi:phloretin hydrolase